jgi:O-antigen/teichoic acid export membrane protein
VGLVSIPLLIGALGAARFGVLALAWIVLNYFGVFDLGIGRATTKFVAEALGGGTPDAIPSITWTAVLAQFGLGVTGGLALAIATPFLVGRLLNIPADLTSETQTAFYELAFAVPLVLISGSFRGVLEAAQRFDLVNFVKAPFASANFLLPLLAAALGWGLPGVVGLLIVARAVALLSFLFLCLRVFPTLRRAPRFALREARTLFRFGGWITVSSLVAPVIVYVDRFMIGTLLSVSAVTYYVAPYEMITRLWIIPTSLVSALFPAFSAMSQGGRPEQAGAIALRSVKFLIVILGPIVVLLAVLANDILRVWLGASFAHQATNVARVLACGVFLNALAQVPYSQIQAAGRPDLTAKFHLAELPVQIVLVWALVRQLGLAGAAVASSTRMAVDACLLFVAATRLSPVSWQLLTVHRVPRAALLILVFALVATVLNGVLASSTLRLSAIGAVFLATIVLAWLYVLDEQDRSRVAGLVRLGRPR